MPFLNTPTNVLNILFPLVYNQIKAIKVNNMYMVVREKISAWEVEHKTFLHITCELSNYKVHIQQFRMMTALFLQKALVHDSCRTHKEYLNM